MEISIFGFKFNLEILILIAVVYLIMAGHTLCGCCNYGLMEGLEMMTNKSDMSGNVSVDVSGSTVTLDVCGNNVTLPTQLGSGHIAAGGAIVARNAKDGSAKVNGASKEGFVGANTNNGESSLFDSNTYNVDTSSWMGQSKAVVGDRKSQPVPLPEGEMFMFATTPFKPECCPNTYSNGSGCACMTDSQYNYLMMRGSNNVPYSQY
jgi:hypothetical protein